MSEKGKEIRFIKGKYQGCVGWLNSAVKKKKKAVYRHVIIKGEKEEDKLTKVKESSYRKPFAAPQSYEEACLQQHSDIELAMVQLAEMFAECKVHTNNVNIASLFEAELKRAVDYQVKLGNRARYRAVDFADLEEMYDDGEGLSGV